MINSKMRAYDYFQYGDDNGYGQPSLSTTPVGTIKMAIHNTSTSIQDNIIYKGATYVGLTHDKGVDDTYVIQYGEERLKVLYVTTEGRYRQAFMNTYG
jgi:hypothetical protein